MSAKRGVSQLEAGDTAGDDHANSLDSASESSTPSPRRPKDKKARLAGGGSQENQTDDDITIFGQGEKRKRDELIEADESITSAKNQRTVSPDSRSATSVTASAIAAPSSPTTQSPAEMARLSHESREHESITSGDETGDSATLQQNDPSGKWLYLGGQPIPPEIRLCIYDALVEDYSDRDNRGPYNKLSDQSEEMLTYGEEAVQLILVEDNGENGLFRLQASLIRRMFTEMLVHMSHSNVVFSFSSSESFSSFTYGLWSLYGSRDLPTYLKFEFNIFHSDAMEQAHSLNKYEYDFIGPSGEHFYVAHGYPEGAREHVQGWMDAVRRYATPACIRLVMQRPWRDYEELRYQTEILRTGGHRLMIRFVEENWLEIPNPELHLVVALASILGIRLDRQKRITDHEVYELLAHGCRGMRIN